MGISHGLLYYTPTIQNNQIKQVYNRRMYERFIFSEGKKKKDKEQYENSPK